MKTRTTINELDVKTIRKLKEQLASVSVKPSQGGVFWMVATKKDLRKNLKGLGFTTKEIREIMSRTEKVEELE